MEKQRKLQLKLILKLLGKVLTVLALPFFGYGFSVATSQMVKAAAPNNNRLISFGIGFVLFLIVWVIFRRALQVVCTFEHELTHLVFGLLFLKRPHAFVVTLREGGHVKLSGSNFLIFLAPYFFPTISYFLIPIAFFVPRESMPVYLSILGASVAFHLV
ncbi:MAG: hypothetical protein HKN25_18325 [Pyrinomonadaceae bacterium]|nr:hypothetical protein [Pyrinomonadaceae bacterium]